MHCTFFHDTDCKIVLIYYNIHSKTALEGFGIKSKAINHSLGNGHSHQINWLLITSYLE